MSLGRSRTFFRVALVVAAVLTACSLPSSARSPSPRPAAAVPTLTLLSPTAPPTPTSSPTPANTPISSPTRTSRPTRTPTPTRTRTITRTKAPTSTLPPEATRTPLVPTPDPNGKFRLVDWSPERAQALIDTMMRYPEGLEGWDRGRLDSIYAGSFSYAGAAEAEAALRFPADSRATQWRWNSAYDQSLMFNPRIDQEYSRLIVDGLNTGQTDLQGLQNWFQTNEARLNLEIHTITPPQGYTSSLVLEIWPGKQSITMGGFFLWLLGDSKGFHAYPLRDQQWFETGHDAFYSIFLVDLTGDGISEAISSYNHRDAGINQEEVQVYDLSQVPPRKLTFQPEPDTFYLQFAPGWETQAGRIAFIWEPVYDDPVIYESEYRWDGQVLRETSASVRLRDDIEADATLTDTLTTDMLMQVEAGHMLYVEPLKAMLASYPLGAHGMYSDTPYHPDARDVLRFRLGIALAFHKDAPGAIQQMQTIVNTPVILTSTWIAPAQQFLELYHQPGDLPATCLKIGSCSSFYHLPDLLSILPPTSPILPLNLLSANGKKFDSSGEYDFDHDGKAEYWAISSNGNYSDLEIIYAVNDQYESEKFLYAIPVTETTTISMTAFVPLPKLDGGWIYNVQAQKTSFPFIFNRSSDGSVQVTEFTDQIYTVLQESEQALLSGGDPKTVLDRLDLLAPGINSETCDWIYNRSCSRDQYLYLYSLAQELSGDRTGAAATNLQLWQSYPYSPFAIMARAKLEPIP
jgi:hypothetical protein